MTMKTTALCLASVLAFAPASALAANAVVVNPTGQMHVYLSVTGADDIDGDVPIASGRLELAPAEGVPVAGGRFFMLTLASLRIADFNVDHSLYEERRFREVSVRQREAVGFTALEVSPGVYNFSIPRTQVTYEGNMVVNGDIETGVDRPSEAVTGTIDLNAGTMSARVKVPKHYGCSVWPCSVDGHLTITLSGVLGPDTDGDGIRDGADNCPLLPNPSQRRVISPVITPPPDITLVTCQHRSIGRATAVDVCEAYPTEVTDDMPPAWQPGATVVGWRASTPTGRISGASQTVTVIDRTPPAFTVAPKPISVDTCGPVDLGPAVAADDCDFGGSAVTNDGPKEFGPGTTLVTWTAWDRSRNRATLRQAVTVNDKTPPEFEYVPKDVKLSRCLRSEIGEALARDACGVKVTNDAPEKLPPGETTVTWTAIDGAGNVATAKQLVVCGDGTSGRY
jgi:hypothetical protein